MLAPPPPVFWRKPTREQIFRISGDRRTARLFRGWNRLKLNAVSCSATAGALPTVTTTTTRAIGAETMEREATSATDAAVENVDGDMTHRRARAAMMASDIVCRVVLVLVYMARSIYLSGAL